MNYATKLVVLVVVQVILISLGNVSLAEENRMKMEAEHDSKIIPYTYLPVRLTITNQSEDKIWVSGFFPEKNKIRTLIEDEDNELIYEGFTQVLKTAEEREAAPPVKMGSGESSSLTITLKQAWFGRGREGIKPIFREPGVYHINFQYIGGFLPTGEVSRFRYTVNPDEVKNGRPIGGERKRETVKSEIKTVRVLKVENYQQSLQAIKELSNPGMLITPDTIMYEREAVLARDVEVELRNFLSEHSQSPWAPYAYHALGMAYWRLGREAEEQKEELSSRALEMFEKALESAEQHEKPHLRLEIMESKVRLLSRLGEREKARAIRNKLQKEKRVWKGLDPEPEPEPGRDEHPLEGRKRLERRIEELEAEGYDPTGMREHAPEAWEEYFERRVELRKLLHKGELMRKDYYDKMASVVERLTREHLEPMNQDALRRQIEERERRRKAQRRQREEERRRWREENPEEYIKMLRGLEKAAEELGVDVEIDEDYIRDKLPNDTEEESID